MYKLLNNTRKVTEVDVETQLKLQIPNLEVFPPSYYFLVYVSLESYLISLIFVSKNRGGKW